MSCIGLGDPEWYPKERQFPDVRADTFDSEPSYHFFQYKAGSTANIQDSMNWQGIAANGTNNGPGIAQPIVNFRQVLIGTSN